MQQSTAAWQAPTCSLTGNKSISPYLFRNLPTRARYLLARPMTSSTGMSCRRLMGKLSAIQHLPVRRLGCRCFLALASLGACMPQLAESCQGLPDTLPAVMHAQHLHA